jgi:lipopolysaccharide biosynthesis protein
MATHWGTEGQVKLGSNAVGEIIEFEFTEKVEPVDDTAMGDTYKTHIASSGIKEWSGSMTCHWDEGDTNGQVALTVGSSVTLNLYPEGSTTGDIYWSGTATLTERSQTVKMDGETIRATFTFMGNGTLTRGTAA